MAQEWLTVEQVAAELGVHPKTVARWCRSGELASTVIGRTRRIRRADLATIGQGQVAREPIRPGRVLAVANQKGGVGKSTTALNLAAALGERGERVVVVDLDPQASLTLALTGRVDVLPGLMEIVRGDITPAAALLPTAVPGVSLLPCSMSLGGFENYFAVLPGREHAIRRVVAELAPAADTILLDCPPNLSAVTVGGLRAADAVLIPILPRFFSAMGLQLLLSMITSVRTMLEHDTLRVAGILLTQIQLVRGRARAVAYREVIDDLRARYGDLVLPVTIPESVLIEEAQRRQVSVLQHAPDSPVAAAYRQLVAALETPRDWRPGGGGARSQPAGLSTEGGTLVPALATGGAHGA